MVRISFPRLVYVQLLALISKQLRVFAMDNRIPRATLEQLHRELMKARSEEHQVQKRLEELSRDVRQMLDKPEEEHLHHRTLKENLQNSVRHFEASHPELTSVINNVLTSLAKMGI
jgi:hypothetical protein